jgi:hypothetical protein
VNVKRAGNYMHQPAKSKLTAWKIRNSWFMTGAAIKALKALLHVIPLNKGPVTHMLNVIFIKDNVSLALKYYAMWLYSYVEIQLHIF